MGEGSRRGNEKGRKELSSAFPEVFVSRKEKKKRRGKGKVWGRKKKKGNE